MANYYIDKRIFVNGKKSVMFMDDPFNITQYIIELINTYAITCAQNGLNIQTSLSNQGTMINCVELGGSLLHNTSVIGNGWNLGFNNINTFNIQANTKFNLETPNIASASNGWVLTLINQSTGEAEWQPTSIISPQVQNALTINGNFIEWGGTLIKDTLVTGNGTWSIDFDQIFNYRRDVQENHWLKISGSELSAGVGGVLTLIDPLTGLSEWQALPSGLTNNIYNTDGSLTSNRTLAGVGSSLTFTELTGFSVIDSGDVLIDDCDSFNVENTDDIRLAPTSTLELDTPGASSGTNNISVLTLVDNTTGECEWQSPTTTVLTRYVQSFNAGDWTAGSSIITGANDIVITAATHGRGIDPIVQVCIDDYPSIGTCAVVNTTQNASQSAFGAITIDPVTGDVTLTDWPPSGITTPTGKVIIL